MVLDEQVSRTLLDTVKIGAPLHTAAAFAGVSDETLRLWRRRGEKAQAVPPGRRSPTDRRFVEFVGALDKAMSTAATKAQAVVFGTMAQTDDRALAFRAAIWYLEHRERADNSTRIEQTGRDGGPIEMSPSEAYGAIAELARQYGHLSVVAEG